MKRILLGIVVLILMVSVGYCGNKPLSPEEELTLLHSKISELESACTPEKGTPKEEVERIFGEGKPASIGKLPLASPDSPNRSYELCKDGILIVRYKDNKVLWAHYVDPYSVKGRYEEPSVEEQLREAKPRLKQMEVIHAAYLKRLNELNQPLQRFDNGSSLTLTIKSDKEVYEVGNEIKIYCEIQNVSDKTVKFYPYMPQAVALKSIDGKPCYHEIFQTVERAGPLLSLKPGEKIPYSLTGYVLKTEGIIGYETPGSEKIISKKSGKPFYKVYGVFVKFGSEGLFSSVSSYYLEDYGKYEIAVYLKDANTMSDKYRNLKPEERDVFLKDKWQGALTSNTITIEVVEKK